MIQWMKERAHEAGLRPVEVLLTSAKKANEMENLLKKIEEYREGRDVYIVGVTNVGKSTLINHQEHSRCQRCDYDFSISRDNFR